MRFILVITSTYLSVEIGTGTLGSFSNKRRREWNTVLGPSTFVHIFPMFLLMLVSNIKGNRCCCAKEKREFQLSLFKTSFWWTVLRGMYKSACEIPNERVWTSLYIPDVSFPNFISRANKKLKANENPTQQIFTRVWNKGSFGWWMPLTGNRARVFVDYDTQMFV